MVSCARAASEPVLVGGPPLQRAAGARSGASCKLLDGQLPLHGLVGDTLKREPRGQAAAWRNLDYGDAGATTIVRRSESPVRMGKRLVAIPGYGGHIEGKVAENLHGGTWRIENDRTIVTKQSRDMRRSASDYGQPRQTLAAPPHSSTSPAAVLEMRRRHGMTRGLDGVGLEVAPHIPGTMTHIPGKDSESIFGYTFSEANQQAQQRRRHNPFVNSEGWVRKGEWPVDRRSTYRFLNRAVGTDSQPLFSYTEDIEFAESNKRLAQMFGGLNPARPSVMKPGDRFMQSLGKKVCTLKEPRHIDASGMRPAGEPSYSPLLDGERIKAHNILIGTRKS